MGIRRYGLSDSQCERIKDFLPGREDHVGGTASDSRLFVEAVLYHPIALAFPDAAACLFGDWKSIHPPAVTPLVRKRCHRAGFPASDRRS
ncbi:hypothetical protein EDC15_10979 [Acetobacter aceti NBRC 14818]|nr:hypothetical protein EDC15_10979 [Acetobacter aceti NBRC 14818]